MTTEKEFKRVKQFQPKLKNSARSGRSASVRERLEGEFKDEWQARLDKMSASQKIDLRESLGMNGKTG